MQVDSPATCNTLPSCVYKQISGTNPLQPSHAKIYPYSGKAIRPIGKLSLACEGPSHFESLEFHIIDSKDIPGKPALISGKDERTSWPNHFPQYACILVRNYTFILLPHIHTQELFRSMTYSLLQGQLQRS